MAVLNTVPLGTDFGNTILGSDYLYNESVSFSSSAGENTSTRTVPADEIWELQTMRGLNGEAQSRDMAFLITDDEGTLHGHLSMTNTDRTSIPTGTALSWNGKVIIPSGWRIGTRWYSMAGGSTCNWQFTAITRPYR